MSEAGKYILSIGAGALITGILNILTDPKTTSGTLTKMACGLFLMIIMIKPIVGLNLNDLEEFADRYTQTSAASVDYGEELAEEELRQRIRQQTEAYILDKAGLYGADLKISVTLADGGVPVPESVVIRGKVSPYAKSRLQQIIKDDLGIPEEYQKWTQ